VRERLNCLPVNEKSKGMCSIEVEIGENERGVNGLGGKIETSFFFFFGFLVSSIPLVQLGRGRASER
jgi:hypothetical protein